MPTIAPLRLRTKETTNCRIWVAPQLKRRYRDCPDTGGNRVSAGTCYDVTSVECLGRQDADFADAGEIQEVIVPAKDLPVWRPSPDSTEKQMLLRALWELLVREFPSEWRLVSPKCNDFNTLDPMVAVLVEVVETDGRTSRVIVWLRLNAGVAPYFWSSRREHDLRGWEHLVEGIVSDGIDLPVEGSP